MKQVDLVIEFQTDELIAPAIASKYMEANIPFIAIDIPHPGATYFGANNYQAGLDGGQLSGPLGQTALGWRSGRDPADRTAARRFAAQSAHARSAGGHHRSHPVAGALPRPFRSMATASFRPALERVRKHLRESKAKRILVGAANDSSALGALRAFQEAGRANDASSWGRTPSPKRAPNCVRRTRA